MLVLVFPKSNNTIVGIGFQHWVRDRTFSVLSVITDVGSLPAHLLLALAPPGRLGADRFRLEHEALGLDNVEEQLAHHVGVTRVGHLEAGAESVGGKNKELMSIDFW